MSKTGKMLAIAVGAFLLYEWNRQQQPTGPGGEATRPTDPSSQIPIWVQQLESDASGSGSISSTTTDTIGGLLSIPQGPGGTAQDFSGVFGNNCILGG